MGRNVSALIGKSVPHIPEKCKDPGTFCIPCIIGNSKFENVMLDLGASINVMPLSIFKSLSLGPLQPTGVVIQLANRSVAHPISFIEDFLVRVGELIFPVDFYVLDMEEGLSYGSVPIILGRPFLKIAQTKIDVYAGTLSMEFGDIVVNFNILDVMKFPSEDHSHSVFRAELIDDLVDEHIHDFDSFHDKKHSLLSDLYNCLSSIESKFEFGSDFDCDDASGFDALGVVPLDLDFIESKCTNHVARRTKEFDLQVEVQVVEPLLPSLVPSDVLPAPTPTPELKPLPKNLKYAYLEDDERFLVIISTSLDADQEERLLHVLWKHKKAIGWTLADIPGISPSTCMHRILLDDGAKPVRQPQRRLNPMILDVVKKEVTKLLQARIIYPISDSQWVSLV
uniref:Transposon Ty3-I Gag-Pol polyprotein n=1 Tax=Cajanus cajan TaxID=3821 RepID=A0A151QN03_CAJCA|nr:hypothetical protein KK1_047938 [Cajanus cajan]